MAKTDGRATMHKLSLCWLLCGMLFGLATATENKPVVIAAAISLMGPLQKIQTGFKQQHNTQPKLNLAASGLLARQILNGAPFDIFISANQQWLLALEQENRLDESYNSLLVKNTLVVVSKSHTQIQDLKELVHVKRIASGNPTYVPLGFYTQQALQGLGLYQSLSPKFILANNAQNAVIYVQQGLVEYGFVYKTDALFYQLPIAYVVPESLSGPINYYAAILVGRASQQSIQLFEFLKSPAAQQIFADYGFVTD